MPDQNVATIHCAEGKQVKIGAGDGLVKVITLGGDLEVEFEMPPHLAIQFGAALGIASRIAQGLTPVSPTTITDGLPKAEEAQRTLTPPPGPGTGVSGDARPAGQVPTQGGAQSRGSFTSAS